MFVLSCEMFSSQLSADFKLKQASKSWRYFLPCSGKNPFLFGEDRWTPAFLARVSDSTGHCCQPANTLQYFISILHTLL